MKKLLVAVIGNRDSGKSETWKVLIDDQEIRTTQKKLKKLYFNRDEYTDVFLINGSPQERNKNVEEIIAIGYDPEIVLCSIQYTADALNTLSYFVEKNYYIYLHWLNPGYKDKKRYSDYLNLIPTLLELESVIGQRDGKVNLVNRVEEVKNFIHDWSKRSGLLKNVNVVKKVY